MRRRTVFLINCVGVMERMDEQIVPALSRPLGCAFRAGPHALGLITFARALVQAVASPLGGIAVSAEHVGGGGGPGTARCESSCCMAECGSMGFRPPQWWRAQRCSPAAL